MFRALMEKDNIQEKMGSISRDMETLKESKGNVRNPMQWNRRTFDGSISRLNISEERMIELEDFNRNFEAEMQREKRMKKKKKNSIRELWDNFKRCKTHTIGIPEGKE